MEMGWSMATGDVNGDGLCDIAVGAIEYRVPGASGTDHGAVLIYQGQAPDGLTGGLLEEPTWMLTPNQSFSSTGHFGRFGAGRPGWRPEE